MKEELLKLFSDYLEDVDYLDKQQQIMMMQLGMEGEKLLDFWHMCYQCMIKKEEQVEFQDMELKFLVGEECHLIWGRERIPLTCEHARELIAHLIDLFEPIYPLGTVVELNEEFSKSLNLKKQKQKVRVVIIERFLSTKDKEVYFPYVGTIYPVGTLGRGRCIQFTSSLIDSVVHMGYRDNMDDAYVLLMKKELVIDNDAVSFGFLSEERLDEYKKELGVKDE